jgi:hypothetical protein
MRGAFGVLVVVFAWLGARAAEPGPTWEARALAAIGEGDVKALGSLADEFRRLPPGVRRDLPLRVGEDSVTFAFRGEFPADKNPGQMLEYLVSGPEKDYESLLVVSAAEQKRVQTLRPFFEKHAGDGRRQWWSARLVWAEGGMPRSADLADLLLLIKPAERNRFRDGITVNNNGLGGDMNVEADPASLPRQRVPALVLLTVRLTPAK